MFWFILFLSLFLCEKIFSYILDIINVKYITDKTAKAGVPKEFRGVLDEPAVKKSQSYSIQKARFGVVNGIFDDLITLIFLFGGLLNIYNNWVTGFQLPFILKGIMFFLLLVYAQSFIGIPFNIFQNFKIEKAFGFNTMTAKLWIGDFIKSILMETVLIGILLGAGLWIIQSSPKLWWLWLWLFFFAFSIFMMFISPYVIEPLFNKFTPVEDEELLVKIKTALAKTGIEVSRVFKMDASKRSKHTNAYFSGIGHVKRIVLFDTLIGQLTHDELIGVLAHEAGHWKKKHVLKTIISYEIISFFVFLAAFTLIQSNWLTQVFHLNTDTLFAKAVLLGFVFGLASFVFTPISAALSRHNEKEADEYAAVICGTTAGLSNALKKLTKDNLSNLYPHPLYSAIHYSHPPILSRLAVLDALEKEML